MHGGGPRPRARLRAHFPHRSLPPRRLHFRGSLSLSAVRIFGQVLIFSLDHFSGCRSRDVALSLGEPYKSTRG